MKMNKKDHNKTFLLTGSGLQRYTEMNFEFDSFLETFQKEIVAILVSVLRPSATVYTENNNFFQVADEAY